MNVLINLLKDNSPPHTHKIYEIIIYTKGKGIFHTSSKDYEVCPGKIIIVPPKEIHYTEVQDGECERIYMLGDFNQIFFPSSTTIISDGVNGEGLLLSKMIYSNRYSDKEYLSALINAFTHFLLQNIKMEDGVFLAVKEIVDKISEDFYNCDINLTALLKNSGYAEDYIRAQFKRITGKTPTEFLTGVRINHACYLIETYKNVFSFSDVAERCGYTDYIYFSRKFKQIVGVSPRKYMEGN